MYMYIPGEDFILYTRNTTKASTAIMSISRPPATPPAIDGLDPLEVLSKG